MKQVLPRWEHFEHKADIGVRGIGCTIAEAFEQTALAMTAVITDPARIRHSLTLEIECQERDQELLLVDWLNALVYEMTTRKVLLNRFEVTIYDGILSAKVCGESVDITRHEPVVEIKGATYTELEVRQLQDGTWRAQCVVDV
jgi:SHS2 domain-containing protein